MLNQKKKKKKQLGNFSKPKNWSRSVFANSSQYSTQVKQHELNKVFLPAGRRNATGVGSGHLILTRIARRAQQGI
jgi:hypothetical protein